MEGQQLGQEQEEGTATAEQDHVRIDGRPTRRRVSKPTPKVTKPRSRNSTRRFSEKGKMVETQQGNATVEDTARNAPMQVTWNTQMSKASKGKDEKTEDEDTEMAE